MTFGSTFLVISIAVVAIWLVVEVKKMRHKVFAISLILLILLSYLSFATIAKQNDITLRSVNGVVDASKLYLSWLGSIGGNIKVITLNAIKMDWTSPSEAVNKTSS